MHQKIFKIFVIILNPIIIFSMQTNFENRVPKEKIPKNIAAEVKKEIEGLYSANPVFRQVAAQNLGKMGEKATPAIPFLIGIFHDTTDESPLKHRKKEGNITTDLTIHVNLNPGDTAADALGKIGSAAIEPLIKVLNDKHPYVRMRALRALGNFKDYRFVNHFVDAIIKDSDWRVQQCAAEALIKIEDPRTIKYLVPLIDFYVIEVQRVVRDTLKKFSQSAREPLIDALIDALKNGRKDLRGEAAIMLGKLQAFRAIEPLVSTLQHENEWIRTYAAAALARLKDPRGIQPLVDALRSKYVHIPGYALSILREVKNAASIEPLIASFTFANKQLRERIGKALGEITGEDFGPKQGKWKRWWRKNKDSFKE
jgi:hypothetical protein